MVMLLLEGLKVKPSFTITSYRATIQIQALYTQIYIM